MHSSYKLRWNKPPESNSCDTDSHERNNRRENIVLASYLEMVQRETYCDSSNYPAGESCYRCLYRDDSSNRLQEQEERRQCKCFQSLNARSSG